MRHSSKTLHFLPYSAAREYVRTNAVEVKSRAAYHRWHDSVKPEFLPRNPDKVYEGFSWNDFLDTTNSFDKTLRERIGMKVSWRPFWEAVRYAQRMADDHGITTQQEWEAWHDSGMCAPDVPKRPQLEYSEFKGAGWPVWLGKNIKGKIMTEKHTVALFGVHTTTTMPKNMLTIINWKDGLAQMREAMAHDPSLESPKRLYKWEPELAGQVHQTIQALCSEKGNRVWLCHNVHELFFELDNLLEWAVRPKG